MNSVGFQIIKLSLKQFVTEKAKFLTWNFLKPKLLNFPEINVLIKYIYIYKHMACN